MNFFRRVVQALERRRMQRKYAAYNAFRDSMLRALPADSVGAEIGTWKGDYARRMITIAKPRELHLIDPYLFIDEYPDRWYGGLLAKSQTDMDQIFDEVTSELETLAGDKTKVIFDRGMSADVLPGFADESLDWAYIDGNHSYEFVKQDIEGLIPKMKTGGLIMGDDLQWEGIERAVNEVLQEQSEKLVAVELKHKYHQYILRKL